MPVISRGLSVINVGNRQRSVWVANCIRGNAFLFLTENKVRRKKCNRMTDGNGKQTFVIRVHVDKKACIEAAFSRQIITREKCMIHERVYKLSLEKRKRTYFITILVLRD